MKERNGSQEKTVHLPPAWCGAICRNAMNEICVEQCAPNRDCSGFDEKPNLKLTDMPRYPKAEGMTKEERFTSVTVYLAKVVDHFQGVEDDLNIYPPIRWDVYSSLRGVISDSVKVGEALHSEVVTNARKADE